MAAMSGIIVASVFTVGERFGSGDWNLPSMDLDDPVQRRVAARLIEEKSKTKNPAKKALLQMGSDVLMSA
jgi:hypothetical protein